MSPPTQPNMGVIMERIANVQCDVSDIKQLLTEHVKAQTTFEQETISTRLVNAEKLAGVQTKVDDHEGRLKKLETLVSRLAVTDAILRFVAVLFMTSVIGLIWALVTNQVTIGIP